MGVLTFGLLVFKIVTGAFGHLGSLVTIGKDLFGSGVAVFKVLGQVVKGLYGVTHSVSGSIAMADVAHIVVMILVYLGGAVSFTSWIFTDMGSALAWIAAGIAGFVTWLHKVASNPPAPASSPKS